jgi:16S rRNA (adenine1518-N6/adenine1519-N6)-dimethyltransferase
MDLDKGQHMLIDEEILRKEIEIADLCKKDKVLEIGAGTGNLTKELVKNAGKVVAIEIDKDFKKELEEIKEKNKNLIVIYDNALEHDWKDYNKIVSNIPYSLSEPVVLKAIKEGVEELILIIGENFKEILSARKSKIGIIADLFYKFQPIKLVKKESFNPKPRVDSWLIKLERKDIVTDVEEVLKKIVLKDGKTKNAIMYSLVEHGKTKNEAREIIDKMGINNQVLEKPVKKITGKFLLRLKESLKI